MKTSSVFHIVDGRVGVTHNILFFYCSQWDFGGYFVVVWRGMKWDEVSNSVAKWVVGL